MVNEGPSRVTGIASLQGIANTQLGRRRPWWRSAAYLRRTLIFILILVQVTVGTYYFSAILPRHRETAVETCLVVVFAVLFAWIATGFWTAVLGFALRRFGGDRCSLLRRHKADQLDSTPAVRTAIVMPLYHEPVERSLAGLRAIYESLERLGHLGQFDFFILSDSRDPEIWLGEQACWHRLCQELHAFGRIHYRRRTIQMRHKSGNIADFLRRWGSNYQYFMVLDADSVMSGHSIVRMVNIMELEPSVGILQSNPAIIRARSAFARVHQFASRAYGSIFAAGLAGLQLGDAAYWGHNALIRTAPFMKFCGLRNLSGLGLFSGPITSHDFVEAAFMRRAGYEVWFEPGMAGSYEEYPPTLVDDLARDRRWCKGNMQHIWLLARGRGIKFAHRMVFSYGVMSYLASPLWLLFLVLSTIEVARFTLWPINYFPTEHSLFPFWPQWHPDWAIGLVTSVIALLFLPKLLAVIDLVRTRQVHGFGGFGRLICSVLLESLVSILIAPIRMLEHTRFVFEAAFNMSFRWAGQNRSAETEWREALIHHAPGTVAAASWAGFAFWLKPLYFLWSLPITLALILAAPTSVLLSRIWLGEWLYQRKLMTVPEESSPPEILVRQLEVEASTPQLQRNFEEAVVDPRCNALHVALARRRSYKAHNHQARLRRRCLEHGPGILSAYEQSQLVQDGESLLWLHRAVWRAPPESYWGYYLDERRRRHNLWGVASEEAKVIQFPAR
jgi:membrane glycosyltransferase